MVGLGEERDEILTVFDDLRRVGVSILTIGQYLRPSPAHATMTRYYHPDEFADLKRVALDKGFVHVESGPLVRSSYHAHEQADAFESLTAHRSARRPSLSDPARCSLGNPSVRLPYNSESPLQPFPPQGLRRKPLLAAFLLIFGADYIHEFRPDRRTSLHVVHWLRATARAWNARAKWVEP